MTTFANRYRAHLRNLAGGSSEKVTRGQIKSMEEYREKCGEIRAYGRALEDFNMLIAQYTTEDDGDIAL